LTASGGEIDCSYRIFDAYLDGMTFAEIAHRPDKEGVR
jgi:hypothetical protein